MPATGASVEGVSKRSTVTRGLAIAAVCVLGLVAGIGLAWWQWDRYSSAGGTFQNLGYVLQWPLFGLFPLFMVWRMRRLRQRADQERTEPQPSSGAAEPRPQRQAGVPITASARSVAATGPVEPADDELAAYNRYLAELNARDREGN